MGRKQRGTLTKSHTFGTRLWFLLRKLSIHRLRFPNSLFTMMKFMSTDDISIVNEEDEEEDDEGVDEDEHFLDDDSTDSESLGGGSVAIARDDIRISNIVSGRFSDESVYFVVCGAAETAEPCMPIDFKCRCVLFECPRTTLKQVYRFVCRCPITCHSKVVHAQ
jgi:hypothetical protein